MVHLELLRHHSMYSEFTSSMMSVIPAPLGCFGKLNIDHYWGASPHGYCRYASRVLRIYLTGTDDLPHGYSIFS